MSVLRAALGALTPLAIELAFGVLGWFFFLGIITGVMSLVRRRSIISPGRLITISFVLGALASIPAVPQAVQDVRMAFQASRIRDINEVYRELVSGDLSSLELRARIAELPAESWPDEVVNAGLSALALKATRYGDVYQSFAHREFVRTPLDASLSRDLSAELEARDEATWVPILESAAGGGPVVIADSRISTLDEAYGIALGSQWAYSEIADAFKDEHQIVAPRTPAQEELPIALDWLGAVLRSDDQALITEVFAMSDLVWDVLAGTRAPDDVLDLLVDGPRFGPSVITYTWSIASINVQTEIALARSVLEDGGASITRLNLYRHFLALPIVTQTEIDDVVSTRRMPDWSTRPDRAITPQLLATLKADARSIERTFAFFAPAWTPPAVTWN